MKKALSLALALMMLFSLCIVPAVAAEADGSAENPYYVTNPMYAPYSITIPANSTVYYQYRTAVFNGWSVESYGLSAITVDGVVYDILDMWGALKVEFNFNFMSPGLIGYVNNTDEDIDVMLTHTQPVGTEENPAELQNGDNALYVPANVYPYVAEYLPEVSGEYTFACDQGEDFNITVIVDGVEEVLNGSLTLTLESYIPVYVVVSPIGMTGDVILTVTPPKVGTEENPIWLSTDELELSYVLSGTTWFELDAYLGIHALTVESTTGSEFTVTVDGVACASKDGQVKIALESIDWFCYEIVIGQDIDLETEIRFSVEYPEGAFQNPIKLEMGNNAISIPDNTHSSRYYYVDIVADGALLAIPSDLATIGYMDMYDAEYKRYAWLPNGEEASSMEFNVVAGDRIYFSICGAMDEETFNTVAVDVTLSLSIADRKLILGDGNGDGNVNNRDLALLQRYLNDWAVEIDEDALDTNRDGRINNRDFALLQQYLNDLVVTLGG